MGVVDDTVTETTKEPEAELIEEPIAEAKSEEAPVPQASEPETPAKKTVEELMHEVMYPPPSAAPSKPAEPSQPASSFFGGIISSIKSFFFSSYQEGVDEAQKKNTKH